MGSICYIERNPKRWTVFDRGERLRATHEPLVTVRCGDFDDYPSGTTDIELRIRKSVLDKLLAGEYHVDAQSRYCGYPVIVDTDGALIEPVEAGFCC